MWRLGESGFCMLTVKVFRRKFSVETPHDYDTLQRNNEWYKRWECRKTSLWLSPGGVETSEQTGGSGAQGRRGSGAQGFQGQSDTNFKRVQMHLKADVYALNTQSSEMATDLSSNMTAVLTWGCMYVVSGGCRPNSVMIDGRSRPFGPSRGPRRADSPNKQFPRTPRRRIQF